MTTQYGVIPFLQWYETHTSANFEKDTFSQIIFLKSINSFSEKGLRLARLES